MKIHSRFFTILLMLTLCISMSMPVFATNELSAQGSGGTITSDDSAEVAAEAAASVEASVEAGTEEIQEAIADEQNDADQDVAGDAADSDSDSADPAAGNDTAGNDTVGNAGSNDSVNSADSNDTGDSSDEEIIGELVTDDAQGAVSADGYIEIRTAADLNNVRNNLSANYRLMANIDLTNATAGGGAYYNGGKGWTPIGETMSAPFTGKFDGNGYAITGLKIKGRDTEYAGLFGVSTGTIENLAIRDGSISGDVRFAGGIAGYNDGIISACSNTSDISAEYTGDKSYAGGIAGINHDTIRESFNTGTIHAVNYIGGIAGGNDGTISDCYHAGSIKATDGVSYSGGITAVNSKTATIKNVYSVGTHKGDRSKAGSLVGVFAGNASGKLAVCDLGLLSTVAGGSKIGEEYLFEEMEQKSTYSGFNFTSVWEMGAGPYNLPILSNCPYSGSQNDISIPMADVYMGPISTEVPYDGNLKRPNIFVSGLTLDKNYKISGGAVGPGEATVSVNGIAPFSGSGIVKFIISEPKLSVKSLWASQHDVGRVKFKFTVKDGKTVTGWNLKYRWRKIGGDNEWSDWEILDNLPAKVGGAGDDKGYWIEVPTDYAIEVHAQAVGDTTWSTGIITTPAGGKYQAMKNTRVKNIDSGKYVGNTITIKKGHSISVRPDYEYPVKDYNKRPRLYPNHLLYDVSDKSVITIFKPDGLEYTAGLIDGIATIRGDKVGSTKIIFRSPNGRTQVSTIVVTN